MPLIVGQDDPRLPRRATFDRTNSDVRDWTVIGGRFDGERLRDLSFPYFVWLVDYVGATPELLALLLERCGRYVVTMLETDAA